MVEKSAAEGGAAGEAHGWEKVKGVLRRLGPAGPMAVVASTLPPLGGFVLVGTVTKVAPWLREHGALGPVLYAGAFVVLAGLAVIPTYATSVVGGWAFGFRVGFVAAMAGFVGAALLAYVVGRKGAGDRVIRMIEEKPKWRAVHQSLLGSGFGKSLLVVTLLRLPPTSPFAVLNLLLAATRVNLTAYVLGTLIGMSPRTAVVVYAAAGFSQLDFEQQAGQAWMFVAGIVVTVVVIFILGSLAHRAVEHVTGGREEG